MAILVSISAGDRAGLLLRRNELVEQNLDLARSIARGVAARLPATFELDDLISTAYVGLLHAATRYNPGLHGGTPFSAYARPVIKGAVLDSVRRGAYVEHTRASITEMPERAGAVVPEPEADIDAARFEVRFAAAVAALPERQQRVIDWYYPGKLKFREIGPRLGVGFSRASKIHCEAVRSLRENLAS